MRWLFELFIFDISIALGPHHYVRVLFGERQQIMSLFKNETSKETDITEIGMMTFFEYNGNSK